MKERLIVKNFGPVKDLDIVFNKFTIFIGDQGTGKSTISKLFSSFKWLEKAIALNRVNKDHYVKYNRFKKILEYHRIEKYLQDDTFIKFESDTHVFELVNNSFSVQVLSDANSVPKIMYIPAERSIVSIAEDRPKLLRELPQSSETFYDEVVCAKKHFKTGYQLPFCDLKFSYDVLNSIGWISGDGFKTRMVASSSGIQSALPLCLVSDYLSGMVAGNSDIKLSKEERDKIDKKVADIMSNPDYTEVVREAMLKQLSQTSRYGCFINIAEEPELNLFPASQREVLFSLTKDNLKSEGNMLVLTTHSPYTLAIFNMMILASMVARDADEDTRKELDAIIHPDYQLKPESVSAFRLSLSKDESYCKSILSPQTGQISKNDLDSASDEIMKTYNQLYRLYARSFRKG